MYLSLIQHYVLPFQQCLLYLISDQFSCRELSFKMTIPWLILFDVDGNAVIKTTTLLIQWFSLTLWNGKSSSTQRAEIGGRRELVGANSPPLPLTGGAQRCIKTGRYAPPRRPLDPSLTWLRNASQKMVFLMGLRVREFLYNCPKLFVGPDQLTGLKWKMSRGDSRARGGIGCWGLEVCGGPTTTPTS